MAQFDYDAIVLDVMLPGQDGFELCRQWRERGIHAPILFLTARDDVSDRVQGLNLGGDDYLVKPFAFQELVARIRALLRRGPLETDPCEIHVGDLVIDLLRRRVQFRDRVIPLSLREFQLLEYLARNRGRLVTRSALWEHVWESDAVPDSNVIDVYVRYLRNKLGRENNLIQTIRGSGYILDEPAGAGA